MIQLLVLAGIAVFIWLLVRAMKGHFGPKYFGPVDYGALYWHIVDLVSLQGLIAHQRGEWFDRLADSHQRLPLTVGAANDDFVEQLA